MRVDSRPKPLQPTLLLDHGLQFGEKPNQPEAYTEIWIDHLDQIQADRLARKKEVQDLLTLLASDSIGRVGQEEETSSPTAVEEVNLLEEEKQPTRQLQASLDDRRKRVISRGVWLPAEYYNALKSLRFDAQAASFAKGDSAHHGLVNPKYFKMIGAEGAQRELSVFDPMRFIYDKNIGSPSVAVRAIFSEAVVVNSNVAMTITKITALLQCLGDAKFDALFGKETRFELRIVPEHQSNLWPIFRSSSSLTLEEMQRGDRCVFGNITDGQISRGILWGYQLKHPAGDYHQLWTICRGEGKFSGVGLDRSEATSDQVISLLHEALNADPNHEPFSPEFLKTLYANYFLKDLRKSQELAEGLADKKISREDFDQLSASFLREKSQTKKWSKEVRRLYPEKLAALMGAEVSNIAEVFDRISGGIA